YVFFSFRQSPVFFKELVIAIIVDGVVGFGTGGPFLRILMGNDRFVLCSEFEMFVLDNPGIGGGRVRIVHYSIALVVLLIKYRIFELKTPVFQCPQIEAEVFVNLSCIYYGLCLSA